MERRTKSNPGLCRVILSIRLLNFPVKRGERKRRRRIEDTQNSRRKRNRVGLLCFNLIIWDVLPYPLFLLSLSPSTLLDKFTNNRRERRERKESLSNCPFNCLSTSFKSRNCSPRLSSSCESYLSFSFFLSFFPCSFSLSLLLSLLFQVIWQ